MHGSSDRLMHWQLIFLGSEVRLTTDPSLVQTGIQTDDLQIITVHFMSLRPVHLSKNPTIHTVSPGFELTTVEMDQLTHYWPFLLWKSCSIVSGGHEFESKSGRPIYMSVECKFSKSFFILHKINFCCLHSKSHINKLIIRLME